MAQLAPKQERFCLEYFKLQDGTKAAIAAGYSAKTAAQCASRLLRQVKVKARIKALMAKVESKAIMAASEVLEELSLLGRTDIQDYLTVDEGGSVKVKTFDQMPPGASRAIRKIKEKRVIKQTPGDSGDMILESTLEFELWSKPDALDMLGRHHDLLKGKDDSEKERPVSVNVTFTQATKPA